MQVNTCKIYLYVFKTVALLWLQQAKQQPLNLKDSCWLEVSNKWMGEEGSESMINDQME